MTLHIGFTGTQKGLTLEQHANVREFLEQDKKPGDTFHHGDCIGADEEANDLAAFVDFIIVVHPPEDESKRAWCGMSDDDGEYIVMEPKPYLDRNHDIVDASDLLVACPKRMVEEQRSGTWATVRYARKLNLPIIILWPDGAETHENV